MKQSNYFLTSVFIINEYTFSSLFQLSVTVTENWPPVVLEFVASQWKGECLIPGQTLLLIDALLWFIAKWGQDASEWRPVHHSSSLCGLRRPFSCLSPTEADEMESLVCLCGKLSWPKQVESRGNYPNIWGKCVFFWPKYSKNYLNYSLLFDCDDLDTSFCLCVYLFSGSNHMSVCICGGRGKEGWLGVCTVCLSNSVYTKEIILSVFPNFIVIKFINLKLFELI